MTRFSYKAVDKYGKEIHSEIETDSYLDAIRKLRSMGYIPTQIVERRGKGVAKSTDGAPAKGRGFSLNLALPGFGTGVKSQQVTLFTRQLATLIGAGLPLVRSLNILRDQLRPSALKNVISNLATQVESGGTFSDALMKYPKVFSKLYVNTIKAGEMGGVLEVVLERLADFSEKNQKLTGRIKAAMIYPALVIFVAISVVTFLIMFIVPKFMELFKDLGSELPIPTLILLNISNFLQHQWYIGVIFIVLTVMSYKLLNTLSATKYYIDKIKLNFPVFGVLIKKVAIARFTRTLGTLISSGVQILQALEVTKDTAGNEVVAKSIGIVRDSIREGESIAGPLGKTKIFPLMVVNMIGVGEETGSLDTMLNKIADSYEEEVDTTVGALTSLLEPMLIVTLGLIVGGIVVSMFLPLIKLLTVLSG